MSRHGLSFEAYIEAIETESGRLLSVVAPFLEAPVPSCPEWDGSELARHVAQVFTFFANQVACADPEQRHEPGGGEEAAGEEALEWLTAAADVLVRSLRDAGPEAPCWNWSGENLDTSWVARRMALEVAVHRYDAELTADDPRPIDAELSVDGIDERIEVHLGYDLPEFPNATLGGSLCLCCADAEEAWVLDVGGGRLRCREGRGPASAVVRGSASEVFLFTWNRVGLDELEVTGDRSVAEAWRTLPS